MLWAYLNGKDYALNRDLNKIYFSEPTREKIADSLIFEGNNALQKLYDVVKEEGLVELNAVLSAGDKISTKDSEVRYFEDCFNVVYKSNLENDVKNLNELYKNEIDGDKKSKLAVLIAEKTQQIKLI